MAWHRPVSSVCTYTLVHTEEDSDRNRSVSGHCTLNIQRRTQVLLAFFYSFGDVTRRLPQFLDCLAPTFKRSALPRPRLDYQLWKQAVGSRFPLASKSWLFRSWFNMINCNFAWRYALLKLNVRLCAQSILKPSLLQMTLRERAALLHSSDSLPWVSSFYVPHKLNCVWNVSPWVNPLIA